jgi:hypothetical protein
MPPICEDLADYGVVLLPPSTTEYFERLADIERRLETRPEGSPPIEKDAISRVSEHDTNRCAMLLNKAQVAIASVAYVWVNTGTFLPGTNPSVLLPFGLDPRSLKINAYWSTIFPGSKRLMMCDGSSFGDNSDVRPPAADELSRGWAWSRGGGRRDRVPEKLTLDGVFFVDGGFAGPNRLGSWDDTVAAAEAHLAIAALARETRTEGAPPAQFFDRVDAIIGQVSEERRPPYPIARLRRSEPPDPEEFRKYALQMAGSRVASMRKGLGDEAALERIAAWADAPVPKFHKL